MQGLEQLLLGAGSRVEILARAARDAPILGKNPMFRETLYLADERLNRRVLGTLANPYNGKPPAGLKQLVEAGWDVRVLVEREAHYALEYIIVDREVALVGAGSQFSSKSPNRRVADHASVVGLVAHYRQLWHKSVSLTTRSELLYENSLISAIPSLAAAVVSEDAWRHVIHELSQRPKAVFELTHRQFEELVAAILREHGYEVELTPASRDGGKDLLVAVPQSLGDFLFLVECKHYAPDRPVGVNFVRELYGVVEQQRATAGILVTTSSFTRGAMEFQEPIHHRLSLRDYDDLSQWLKSRSPIIGHGR